MHIKTEIIHKPRYYQCRSYVRFSGGIQIFSSTTVPKLNLLRPPVVQHIIGEVLKDARECFQNLITEIDKELAINLNNEFIEVLENLRNIARESLPELESDLHKFTGNINKERKEISSELIKQLEGMPAIGQFYSSFPGVSMLKDY